MKRFAKIYIEEQFNGRWTYVASTTCFNTCKEAQAAYQENRTRSPEKIRAVFYSKSRANMFRNVTRVS